VTAKIYLEGGGDSQELHVRCREGFRKLLKRRGFAGRLPGLVACGSRDATFDAFLTAHANAAQGDYVAMLVDSEDPVVDVERPWAHLKTQDNWDQPDDAEEEQALLMTTCMETWIASDRQALRDHYGARLQEGALPSLIDMESPRAVVQRALADATRSCKAPYAKGKRSFEILARLDPAELERDNRRPSFKRVKRLLAKRL
jgi:hypothetical protein